MKNKEIVLTFSALATILLGGCAMKTAAPIKRFGFDLSSQNAIAVSSPYRDKVAIVAYPESLNETLDDNMIFSYGKGDRGRYRSAKWNNAAGKLLEGFLVDTLQKSRLFKAVLPYSSNVMADYRLETVVHDFKHLVNKRGSFAKLDIEIVLIDVRTGRLLRTKRFVYREPTPTVDAEGYVAAVRSALKRFSHDLTRWIAKP